MTNLSKQAQTDPLYVIFEHHLYNFQSSDIDRKTFVGNVIRDYLAYLRKLRIAVPKSLEASIIEELEDHVGTMLVKKIYGFLTIQDYQRKVRAPLKRRVRARYAKLAKRETKSGAR